MIRAAAFLLLWAIPLCSSHAQQDQPPQYLGRIIAQTMSYHGAPWLIRENRNKEENTELVMQKLPLREGMVACDLGCGNGYYTLRMAERVGNEGKVIAVDIQPQMLKLLGQRAAKANVTNIEPILGELNDPRLPKAKVDLLLLVDVYHEFSHPAAMLGFIHESLSPEGVVALLEYRTEDPTVPIKRLHKMTKAQIMKEYTANKLKLVGEFNGLPWQHMMFFARDDSPLEEISPSKWTVADRIAPPPKSDDGS